MINNKKLTSQIDFDNFFLLLDIKICSKINPTNIKNTLDIKFYIAPRDTTYRETAIQDHLNHTRMTKGDFRLDFSKKMTYIKVEIKQALNLRL